MLKLFYKDLVLHGKNLLILLVMFTGYSIFTCIQGVPAGLFAGFGALLFVMLPLTALAREDKFGATVLSCSLPVDRKTIVHSKYLSAWAVVLIGMVYLFALSQIVPGSKLHWEQLWSMDLLFIYISIAAVFLAFTIPLVLRFGWFGLIFFLVAFQFLGAALLLVPVFFGKDVNLRAVIRNAPSSVGSLKVSMGDTGFYLSLVLVLGLLTLLSWRISQGLFRRRDL